jgi:two-component system sensor histidine kinase RegB
LERVAISLPEDLEVVWPLKMVATALANLVQNALQASPQDQPVQMEASVAERTIRIRVIDRGTGMPDDVLRRAGEPFFTTKPPGAGMGLGLFVARASIEELGGTLTLDSSVGAGTIATVVLPMDPVTAPQELRRV